MLCYVMCGDCRTMMTTTTMYYWELMMTWMKMQRRDGRGDDDKCCLELIRAVTEPITSLETVPKLEIE